MTTYRISLHVMSVGVIFSDECRRNFLSEYDSCAQNRCTRLGSSKKDPEEWKQLALWLWEAHNSVNVRLMKEKAEREGRLTTSEDEAKARWPSRLECRKCWNDDGTWDDEVIFKYLRIQYWPDDKKTQELQEELDIRDPNEPFVISMDEESHDSSVFLVIPVAAFVCVAVAWYWRKLEKDKTGRHKKTDIL
eukprot:CAMPEP_0116558242 /NCGR_PEP_ID=MMETSP0397-20121206/9705_1 /TAXON_ID=216820 /ORGANISM="Cyclophora tenuis, Strain ECT3854" /LENGTH=190 /DNA_ID=CAMNT_0004083825 /DNA_START=67 /DNA_END=639 /DNA_ORIENTATION=+